MAPWRRLRHALAWAVCVWLASLSVNLANLADLSVGDAPPPPAFVDFTIVAVGDLISHQDVQRSALDAEGGWAELWEEVVPMFRGAALAMANLETPIAPNTGRPGVPFCFNAPTALALALKETGVGLVFTANNHAFDQGPAGVEETLGHLSDAGVLQAGSGLYRAAALAPTIIRLPGGMDVAVLSRTDIFNNCLNQRHDRPWVAALDIEGDAGIIQDIRPLVDAVIVAVHWGEEYHARPSARQRQAAARLVEAGADAIVGHHPHVLQAFEWVEAGGRVAPVAYSLGNFLSNQDRMYDPASQALDAGDSRDGGLMVMTFRKHTMGQGGAELLDARVESLWTDNNWAAHGAGQKRIIRVLTTEPGGRGAGMEALLAKRRARALERLGPG
jgi:poly-gamma-glutamate synthesis protein (capsule biosynthesis protein)